MDEIKAIDIKYDEVVSNGVAYYRLPEHFKEFLGKCLKENDIIGFQWEPGSWNFGVILKAKLRERHALCCGGLGDFGKCGAGMRKGCTGVHCKCMEKGCPNMHYMDCFEHYIHVEYIPKVL